MIPNSLFLDSPFITKKKDRSPADTSSGSRAVNHDGDIPTALYTFGLCGIVLHCVTQHNNIKKVQIILDDIMFLPTTLHHVSNCRSLQSVALHYTKQ